MAPASADDLTLSQTLCHNSRTPPPAVAVLVGGLARGFTRPERWRSLQRNVLGSLGVPDFELILYLKEFREKGPPSAKWRPPYERNLSAGSEPDDHGALHRVINYLAPTLFKIDQDEGVENRLRVYHNRTCGRTHASKAREKIIGPEDRELRHPGVQMGYWHTLKHLWAMVKEREEIRGSLFDMSIFLRPDLVHYLGIGPWCLYRPRTIYHSVGDDCGELFKRSTPRFVQYCATVGASDFIWVAPRAYLEFVATTLDRILSCNLWFPMNEMLFTVEGEKFARESGLTFVHQSKSRGPRVHARARPSSSSHHPYHPLLVPPKHARAPPHVHARL